MPIGFASLRMVSTVINESARVGTEQPSGRTVKSAAGKRAFVEWRSGDAIATICSECAYASAIQ